MKMDKYYYGLIKKDGTKVIMMGIKTPMRIVKHKRFSSVNPAVTWGIIVAQTTSTAFLILEDIFDETIAANNCIDFAQVLGTIDHYKEWKMNEKDIRQFVLSKIIPPFIYGFPGMEEEEEDDNLPEATSKRILTDNYTIDEDKNGMFLYCRQCKQVTHHPVDVENHYCGNCRTFLDRSGENA
jgi:hypothetical protein